MASSRPESLKPFISDAEGWIRHYEAQASGIGKFNKGFSPLKKSNNKDKHNEKSLKIVSETADIVNQAQGQIAHEKKVYKRKRTAYDNPQSRPPPGKRGKSRKLEPADSDDDIFSY